MFPIRSNKNEYLIFLHFKTSVIDKKSKEHDKKCILSFSKFKAKFFLINYSYFYSPSKDFTGLKCVCVHAWKCQVNLNKPRENASGTANIIITSIS